MTLSSIAIGVGNAPTSIVVPRGIWFAVIGKILCVKFVVDREILFHVRQENGDIHDIVPICASVFEHEPHIFKHRATLRLGVS